MVRKCMVPETEVGNLALRPGDRQFIREWNECLVLNTIREHEPLTRGEIMQRTGLGRSTISVITSRLIRKGFVQEVGSASTDEIGRPPTLLRLNARALSVAGIKLAPTEVTAAILDLHAVICGKESLPIADPNDIETVTGTIALAVQRARAQAPPDLGPTIGAGLVMPGVVDPTTGSSVTAFAPGWTGMPFRQQLAQLLDVPVLVDNDANAVALAERHYGAGQKAATMLCVTVGIGIGAGIIIDGRLYRGHRFGAGEIGHTVVAPDGPPCLCGHRGCLEAVAADAALLRASGIPREALVASAHAGDPAARQLLAEAGRLIGYAVANAVNLLSPELVVVGGETALQAGDLLLNPLAETLRAAAFPALSDIPVLLSALGTEAWVKGAALLVLDEAFRTPLDQAGSAISIMNRIGTKQGEGAHGR